MPNRSLLALCIAGAVTATVNAQPVFRFVDPLDTGPGIVEAELPNAGDVPQRHVVAPALGEPRDILLVWLPGSGAAPTQYLEFTRAAAENRLDAVGLVYLSWPPVNDITTNSTDPDLPAAIRTERLFGADATDVIDVGFANSVENRLVKLLEDQAAAFPGERWASYLLPDGSPDWSRIAVAGHSQGAGHAAFLGKRKSMAGVLILAGPGDFVQDLGTAPWLFEPGATPAARTVAFTHVEDRTAAGFFSNQRILNLNAFGEVQNIDGLSTQQIRSQMLASTAAFPVNSNGHAAVVVDDRLARDASGDPIYRPAWDAMLRVPTRCSADTNRDGSLTPADFTAWVIAFNTGRARCDQNADNACTPADFNAWIVAFNAG
ncbi:MAG: GC-type dockerin domain-anchored protein [Planctomycetota bacterium]